MAQKKRIHWSFQEFFSPNLAKDFQRAPDVSVTYVGFIELDDSCGYIIRVKMDDKEITFAPLNLDKVYKKPGMRVRFSISHKLDESKTCATHYQITLERITPLRN